MEGLPKDVCRSSEVVWQRLLLRAKNGVKDRDETQRKVALGRVSAGIHIRIQRIVRFGALNGRVGDDHPKYG
jgi:hypothetical protein